METDARPPRPSSRDYFEIAIICALRLEYNAVSHLLDGYWNDDGDPYGKVYGDQNVYTTGWVGKHNVVLALLSEMGKVSAASAATSFSLSYTKIRLAFLVGICGGVPRTSDGTEILLGDVIVSHRLVQYDFGRRFENGFVRKNTFTDSSAQGFCIGSFLETVQTDRYLALLPEKASGHLASLQEKFPRKYDSPQRSDDRLFRPEYRHKHAESAQCLVCDQCTHRWHPTCEAALVSTCEEMKCDESQLVHRSRLSRNITASPGLTESPRFLIHFGDMASGDTVMKSALDRDEIAEKHNVIAFEMEGAGIFTTLPCLVVKGVCDYSDSHKNKNWQNLAAATAAAVMRTLLMWFSPADPRSTAVSREVTRYHDQQLKYENENLKEVVRKLEAQLRFHQNQLPAQVPYGNLVVVNDALGETYSFSLSFVDSLEFFVSILKRKFGNVGLDKIEHGEWMLQNSRTGHILNLRRGWKVVVKPGQILDMSMIFKKPSSLSNFCPWCCHKNERASSENRHFECQNCLGTYQRKTELSEVALDLDLETQMPLLQALYHEAIPASATFPIVPHPEPKHTSTSSSTIGTTNSSNGEIHSYTRVQIVDVRFRVVGASIKGAQSTTVTSHPTLVKWNIVRNIKDLVDCLSRISGLSTDHCLDVLQDPNSGVLSSLEKSVWQAAICDHNSGTLKCMWKGCNSTREFRSRADLRRHINIQHIEHPGYICPHFDCKRSFQRPENLRNHMRNFHGHY